MASGEPPRRALSASAPAGCHGLPDQPGQLGSGAAADLQQGADHDASVACAQAGVAELHQGCLDPAVAFVPVAGEIAGAGFGTIQTSLQVVDDGQVSQGHESSQSAAIMKVCTPDVQTHSILDNA